MKHYWPATVIAAIIYFALSYISGRWLQGPNVTGVSALLTAVLKTGVFAVIFHYAHGFIARLSGMYDYDPDLDAPVTPTVKEDENA